MTQSYPRAANLLGALALAVADRLREAAGQQDDGLTASEAAALVTLAHHPGQSIVSLDATLGLTHSGAVRLADRLEAAGLVRRAASGRGRTLALHLTDRGRQAAARVLARRQAAAEELTGLLDPQDAAALERVAGLLLAGLTSDRRSARRLCRLCDEPLCDADPGCPVDQAVRP
jgi:MarR family transcriptional regulator, negative regulator of the multidrug operon emrRAB